MCTPISVSMNSCVVYATGNIFTHSTATDVTIIEIEIEIVFLTEHRIESKLYFSCIPSNDLSIEALDRLLTPSRFNASTDRLQRGRSSVIKLFICRRRPPLGWSEREVTGEGVGLVLFLDKQGPRTDIGR